MQGKTLSRKSGVTLIEVTLAVAIFAVVIALSAQSILSFYVAIDIQEERVAAIHSARTVISAIREKREEFRGANETDMVNWTNFFNWINTQNTSGWSSYLTQQDGSAALQNHAINIELYNVNGGAAAVGDNPIEVHVVASWTDGKGRTLNSRVVSRMTDR